MSASNPLLHLNRQLSGMTGYRRPQTLSLNQSSPLATQAPTPEPAPSTSGANDASFSSSPAPPPTSASVPADSASPAASTSSSSSKRKLRPSTSSRDPSTPKRVRPSSSSVPKDYAPPSTRLADLGGVDACIEQMLEHVALPLTHPELYTSLGVKAPRGVLLVGPPGCGKTMMAGAVAGELGLPFISVSAPSIVSGMSGESEKTLRETFEEAAKQAPCILFIDEIDAITPKRENAQREMERRIVAQLLTCMDDLAWEKTDGKPVMVISATNRPDSLDPALRRAGRFDQEITMGVPDEAGRERILRVLMAKLRLSGDFDYSFLAKSTPGYVGADLSALTGAAGVIAVKRVFEQMGTEVPVDLGTAEGAMEALLEAPSAAGQGEDEAMAIEEEEAAAPAPVAALLAPATAPLPVSAPPSGATTPAEKQPPSLGPPAAIASSDSTALVSAVPSLPFSTLPSSLASLPIASFLRRHPTALPDSLLSTISLTNTDFSLALSIVQPSSQREGFTTVPNVTWDDLGALSDVRDKMNENIIWAIQSPAMFERLGVKASCGALLWGPPGCGKTLLAKAVANASKANFISVKGPELLNKYVGESERAVRQLFARARASSPCIIFFDEIDALAPKREDNLSESSARVVNTLLTELDGLEARKQVFVIGATNRPDRIDPAMNRPGRLDKLLYVALPTPAERIEILRAVTRKTPLAEDVDLERLAQDDLTQHFSGADLSSLVREASVATVRELFVRYGPAGPPVVEGQAGVAAGVKVEMRHFVKAAKGTHPSVDARQRRRFETLLRRFEGQPMGHRDEELALEGEGEEGKKEGEGNKEAQA
ncbi:hypothetical protein JCM8547_009098 [Rhodosporidiobolus lusitaniae]